MWNVFQVAIDTVWKATAHTTISPLYSSSQHYSKAQLGCEPKSTISLNGSHLSSLNRPEQGMVFAA